MKIDMANTGKGELFSLLGEKKEIKILFVCLGNICRSPAAEEVMRVITKEDGCGHKWKLDSAGTGRYHIGSLPDDRMRIHARRRGYELTHSCRQVKTSDFEDFDLIVGMDSSNLRNLHSMAPSPEAEEKIIPMSMMFSKATRYDHVPDPYYEGAEGFELVLDLLEDSCRNLRDTISGGKCESE